MTTLIGFLASFLRLAAFITKMSHHSGSITRSLAKDKFFNFFQSENGALVGCVVAYVVILMTFIVVSSCIYKKRCYRRCRIEVRQPVLRDERMAVHIQDESERERQISATMQKRKERRAKYEVFLENNKMVVTKSDFYIPGEGAVMACASKPDLMEGRDIETGSPSSEGGSEGSPGGVVQESHASPVATDHEVLLTLPVKTDDGKPRRVDAKCSICLMDYEEGDTVIWATRKACTHAFHDDCILTWLSKGKKRCPYCRHFFVPGLSVDLAKGIVHDDVEEGILEDMIESGEVSDAAIIEALSASRNPHQDLVISREVSREQQDSPLTDPEIESS